MVEDGDGGDADEEEGPSSEPPFQDALSQPPPSPADAEAMLAMLDAVSARLRSLEREVAAARAIVKGSCPEVAVAQNSFAERLLLSVLPAGSLSSSSPREEEEMRYHSRSSGVAVAAAATAVIAAFVAVRGASSSSSSSRSRV